jgi:hypothetical protein
MVIKPISRKKFILSAIIGIPGIFLINNSVKSTNIPVPVLRTIGRTGIRVTPLCFGATRTNDESLIRPIMII